MSSYQEVQVCVKETDRTDSGATDDAGGMFRATEVGGVARTSVDDVHNVQGMVVYVLW